MGTLKKLKLTSCTEQKDGTILAGTATTDTISLLINPAGYTHERAVVRSNQRFLGSTGSRNAYSAMEPETISFDEVVLDGTGAVARASAGAPVQDVKAQVDDLVRVAYTYVGAKHEPPWVRLLWGDLIFFGCLTSLSINYTMFKPGGQPLRAKLKLTFKGAVSAKEESLKSNRSSPDLSHQVMVLAGDTLPMLCYRIYNDSAYYPEVARFNGLNSFTALVPGTRLLFPPLV
jgi:hypothetical protein